MSSRKSQRPPVGHARRAPVKWAWEHAAEVYRERDLLACALARAYRELGRLTKNEKIGAHVMDARGRAALCVHTPAGQLAWMFPLLADDDATDDPLQANGNAFRDCLSDLTPTPNDWDKAKTADKLARLERLAKGLTSDAQ